MIDSSQYGHENERYQNNSSPEPNNNSNLSFSQCYKTPAYQHVNTMLHLQSNTGQQIHNFYPTPPSDSEENSNHNRLDIENSTPKINDLYYFSNFQKKNLNYENQQSLVQNKTQSEQSNCGNTSSHESSTISPTQNNSLSNNSRYKRRSRTTYSKNQLDILEATFLKTHYPEIRMVDELSSMLNLSTERISIWFQNRRARFKKSRKLESSQPETVANPVYKAVESSYSPACASNLNLTPPNIQSNNLYSAHSGFDTSYLLQQANSVSLNNKNPLSVSNTKSIIEKLNSNKYISPISETRNSTSEIQPSSLPFYQNQYPVIIPNEPSFYNTNNYNFINQSTPNNTNYHAQMNTTHNLNYQNQNHNNNIGSVAL